MYSLPSTSHTRAPLAFWTKNGCPPTARNARTGELTPPGMYFRASANNASDFFLGATRAKYSGTAASASKLSAMAKTQREPQTSRSRGIDVRPRQRLRQIFVPYAYETKIC